MKERGVHLTVDEKVLLHLWTHSTMRDDREAPFEVTQHGIAAAVGVIRSAVPRSVKKLVEKGLLEEKLAHVGRLSRRRKCYFLTKEGRLQSEKLRDLIMDRPVALKDDDGVRELSWADMADTTGRSFDPLDVVMCSGEDGVFDPGAAAARREQLNSFFREASTSAVAPEDKGTLIGVVAGDVSGAVETPSSAEAGSDVTGVSAEVGAGEVPGGPVVLGHPPRLKYFFGRDAELEALEGWLADRGARAMVVYGLPGVGKSSIGSRFLELTREARPETSFLWTRVRRWDSVNSLAGGFREFLAALGKGVAAGELATRGGDGVGELAMVISGALDDGEVIVLDDLHTSSSEVRDLVGAIFETMTDAGRGKLLILSRAIVPFYDRRHVLVDGRVRELELSGLERESAARLLEMRGHRPVGPAADRLIDSTGGHPLTLELLDEKTVQDGLAGDGRAGHPGRGGEAVRGPFRSGSPGAGGEAGAAGPGELDLEAHRNVAIFLDEEVYSRLSEPERLLLERVSAFRYPAPQEAFFIDRKTDLGSLTGLARRCILRETDGLYDVHEVLRSYVYRNIPSQRRARIHSDAARFYDDLLALKRPGGLARSRTSEGHAEASEIVHHLIRAGDRASAADFMLAWGPELIRGPYSDNVEGYVLTLLEEEGAPAAVDDDEEGGSGGGGGPVRDGPEGGTAAQVSGGPGERDVAGPDVRCGLRTLLGDLYSERGQLNMALSAYSGVLEEMGASWAVPDRGGEGATGRGAAGGEGSGGAGKTGHDATAESDVCGPGLPEGAPGVMRRMAAIFERMNELDRAMGLLDAAAGLLGESGDVKGRTMNLGAMGRLHLRMGDHRRSAECFERSMNLLMDLEEMPGMARRLMGEGVKLASGGDLEGALRCFESSMEILERNEDLFDIVRIYDNMGDQYFNVLVTLSLYGGRGDE